MVPIDDSKNGNLAIMDAFGITDREKYPFYPKLVLFHPKDGRFAVMEHPPITPPENRRKDKFGRNIIVSKFPRDDIEIWVDKLEVHKTLEFQQLDLDKIEELNDEVYSQVKKTSRDELYKLETEFYAKNPPNKMKPLKVDLDAMEYYQ